MTSTEINVLEVSWAESSERCLAIRRVVFVDEQSVPEHIEIDGEDPDCRQFLATQDGRPIGTARLKSISDGVKIQRVAVLREARGAGVGRALMQAMIDAAPHGWIVLDAQTAALGFYEDFGFIAEGEEFLDAGIRHLRMRLRKDG